MIERAKIRLYVDEPLGPGQSVVLSREQAHYLFGVMRQGEGARVALFNGRDGEWTAQVAEAGKRAGRLECLGQASPQLDPPDLWLLFAPIKKARTDFIVEKAAEMGARRIVPVLSDFTNSERVRVDRLQAHAVEAAEQCGGTFVPEVAPPVKLAALLQSWDSTRQIMFCDEALAGGLSGGSSAVSPAFAPSPAPGSTEDRPTPGRGLPWAILIGPEGGFSEPERARLGQMDAAHPVSLGPRILRADTAAVAAMTLWQRQLGDWS